jgi:hypothetical protein
MSIGRNIIDRRGERPCLPGFYEVAKRMAEGTPPPRSFQTRVAKALAKLRKLLAR